MSCCVKIAQNISYAQEVKEFMEQEMVAATNSFKSLHPFIYQKRFPGGRGQLQE